MECQPGLDQPPPTRLFHKKWIRYWFVDQLPASRPQVAEHPRGKAAWQLQDHGVDVAEAVRDKVTDSCFNFTYTICHGGLLFPSIDLGAPHGWNRCGAFLFPNGD